jgi:AraC-like DNA-binding protein
LQGSNGAPAAFLNFAFVDVESVIRMELTVLYGGRPHGSDEAELAYGGVSDAALAFAQQCQVAVLACAGDDYIAQVVSIWKCLSQFPRRSSDADRFAAVIAVSRIATGFLSERSIAECHAAATPRRRHAHAVLKRARTHFARPDLTLGSVASELQLSVAFLSRALGAETGHALKSAFRCHLNGIRVLAAIETMRGPASLSAIAKAVGYPRTSELDRQFERWFGASPRAFRGFLRRDRIFDKASIGLESQLVVKI